MHDRFAKRSEYHASADHDPTDHNDGSAAIAVDKYAAHRSCTEEREKNLW